VWSDDARRWRVSRTGDKATSGRYPTKQDAIRFGRHLSTRRDSSNLALEARDAAGSFRGHAST
jgi:hypothetical protein